MSIWSPRVRHALLSLLAIAAAPSAAAQTEGEIISVRVRPLLQIVCTGVCPWFEARVDPQGRVTVRQFWYSDETDRVAVRQITSFLASPAQAAAFRATLEPLRPAMNREADARCAGFMQGTTPDFFVRPRNDDIVIVWRTGRRSIRHTACLGNEAIHGTVQRAVVALGLYIDGRRPDE